MCFVVLVLNIEDNGEQQALVNTNTRRFYMANAITVIINLCYCIFMHIHFMFHQVLVVKSTFVVSICFLEHCLFASH